MTLKTLFAIPIAIILLVTLSLAAMVAGEGWSELVPGRRAVKAVEDMRLLLLLQSDMRAERVATNFILGQVPPIADSAHARLTDARADTDRRIKTIVLRARQMDNSATEASPEPYLVTVTSRLGMARAAVDRLCDQSLSERTFDSLNAIQPMMVWVSEALEPSVAQSEQHVIAADPALSGLLMEERLATSLRDHIGLIAAVTVPRVNNGEKLSDEDVARVRVLVAESRYLVGLLRYTIEMAGPTERMRTTLAQLERTDHDGIVSQFLRRDDLDQPTADDTPTFSLPQRILIPWGEQVNALRIAIVDELVARVNQRYAAREREFYLTLAGCGLVLIAIGASIYLLLRRVVSPLALLGSAIRHVAAGERNTPLSMRAKTREIAELVTAVETLRQAALVADAATSRHRAVEEQRLRMLREAVGIAGAVRQSAAALQRDVADLSQGIDAAIALVASPPPTLAAAAEAIHAGLAELHHSAADLDATFAAAHEAEVSDHPEAALVSHVLTVQAEVDRRDRAVRGFVQSGLAALRDAAATTTEDPRAGLHDLVSEQFERLEQTVATMAQMQASARRAVAIVRELPSEEAPLAV